MDLQSQMSQFSSSQSSQSSQIHSSMDLFSEPPCTNVSNGSSCSSYPNSSQIQYSSNNSGEDSGVLSMKVTRRSNDKFYLKYLSAAGVSSGVAEPAGAKTGRQQRQGGGQTLPGGRMEYDTWKTKAEDCNHRAQLSEVVAMTKECKNEMAESASSVKQVLQSVAESQRQFADAVHSRVTEEIAGQGEVLASIVQMQQQTLSVLQSLKEQTEKSDSRLAALEGKLSLLKGDQKEHLIEFQQKIQDYISTKVDMIFQKQNRMHWSGWSQNGATPTGHNSVKARIASPSPGTNFKLPPSPLLCNKSSSSGSGSKQLVKDAHLHSCASEDHPGEEVKENPISCVVKSRTGCQRTSQVTRGLEVFTVMASPKKKTTALPSSQPLGKKQPAAPRKRRQASSSSQPGRKRRTRAATREQNSKCKVPRYSPLVHLMDHPCHVSPSPYKITSRLQSVRKEDSPCRKSSPVNALDDSLYSSVSQKGTPDMDLSTSTPVGLVASCGSYCSGTAVTSWRGRKQEQSKRFSHVLQSSDSNDPAVQEITATILKHCNLQTSTSPI